MLLFTGLMAVVMQLLANGDPVAEHSALTLARTPIAVHIPEIKLLDEQCFFTLHDGYVEVSVRYLLHNNSNRDFKALPYGFPVDWYGEGPAHWESRDIWSESIVERGWRDSYVKDILFSLNGQSLLWQCSADTILKPKATVCDPDFITEVMWHIDSTLPNSDPLLTPDSGEWHYSAARTKRIIAKYGDSIIYYDPAICRRWYYVHLDIPAGRVVELQVRYRIETNHSRGFLETHSVFRSTHYIGCDFHYDFTPAAYWGDGTVQHFRVDVDTTFVISPGWRCGSCDLRGLPFHKAGKGFCYETRNFKLATAEPMEISYSTSRTHEDVADLLSRRINPDRYTVSLSGVDKKYPASNLSDMDLGTATVIRPDNQDSLYITITLRDSMHVTGILIYNGYCKDLQTWLNNSRIDTVISNGGYYWRTIYGGTPESFTWQGLTDAAIRVPVADRKMSFQFPWAYNNDYREKTKEITLRITAVKPGKKYNDLCISEIIVIGD